MAFFLPGVVSQFAKVLHVSKTMISGAAGSVEATDQAIRGLTEYLMIVLHDDANSSGLDMSQNVASGSVQSFVEELRQLQIKGQGQSKTLENSSSEIVKIVTDKSELKEKIISDSREKIGSLHVDRTKDWIEKISANVNKLLSATFPHVSSNICQYFFNLQQISIQQSFKLKTLKSYYHINDFSHVRSVFIQQRR